MPRNRYRSASATATDTAENPFWISLADMMTGMTALFVVLTCMAMLLWAIGKPPPRAAGTAADTEQSGITEKLSLTQQTLVRADAPPESRTESQLLRQQKAVAAALGKIALLSRQYGFSLNATTGTIDLGNQATFGLGSDKLTPTQERTLRHYVDALIDLWRVDKAVAPLKDITVVGYTDPTGSYLSNLDLSARRSERLMCALLAPGADAKTIVDTQEVRRLFKVGGYSTSNQKQNARLSRRLELKLGFYAVGEMPEKTPALTQPDGFCPLEDR